MLRRRRDRAFQTNTDKDDGGGMEMGSTQSDDMIAMMVMDLSVIAKMMREEILNNLCLLSGWKQNQTLVKRRTLTAFQLWLLLRSHLAL